MPECAARCDNLFQQLAQHADDGITAQNVDREILPASSGNGVMAAGNWYRTARSSLFARARCSGQ
jgi:hypothetical protein